MTLGEWNNRELVERERKNKKGGGEEDSHREGGGDCSPGHTLIVSRHSKQFGEAASRCKVPKAQSHGTTASNKGDAEHKKTLILGIKKK